MNLRITFCQLLFKPFLIITHRLVPLDLVQRSLKRSGHILVILQEERRKSLKKCNGHEDDNRCDKEPANGRPILRCAFQYLKPVLSCPFQEPHRPEQVRSRNASTISPRSAGGAFGNPYDILHCPATAMSSPTCGRTILSPSTNR